MAPFFACGAAADTEEAATTKPQTVAQDSSDSDSDNDAAPKKSDGGAAEKKLQTEKEDLFGSDSDSDSGNEKDAAKPIKKEKEELFGSDDDSDEEDGNKEGQVNRARTCSFLLAHRATRRGTPALPGAGWRWLYIQGSNRRPVNLSWRRTSVCSRGPVVTMYPCTCSVKEKPPALIKLELEAIPVNAEKPMFATKIGEKLRFVKMPNFLSMQQK